MKLGWLVLPLLLGTRPALAQLAPESGLALRDRTEPAQEQQRLEKGSNDDRTRVIARAAARAADHDEAVALLVLAAERARVLELGERELVDVARGLSQRGRTKAARDGLFALLVTPPRQGLDGQSQHQRIAATALAAAAGFPEPPPEGPPKSEPDAKKTSPDKAGQAPPGPGAKSDKTEADKPRPTTLSRLFALAEEPRLEAIITQAFVRHPPRDLLAEPSGPAFFRIGARLGDLRWSLAIDGLLHESPQPADEAMHAAALRAAIDLGDSRVLPRAKALVKSPSAALSIAAFQAWLAFEPDAARAALEPALARGPSSLWTPALMRAVRSPQLLQLLTTTLAAANGAAVPEATRSLAALPHGAGVSALSKLAAQDGTLETVLDALEHLEGPEATAALAVLLLDPRPAARRGAAYALLARAFAGDVAAKRALTSTSAALPAPIVATLAGHATARADAATRAANAPRRSHESRAALADCARSLQQRAPACAYAFGRAAPAQLDDSTRTAFASVLEIADPSVAAELYAGLVQSAWGGRWLALGRGLEHAAELPLRRRLAGLAMAASRSDRAAATALAPSLARAALAEPDLRVARLLAGHDDPSLGRSHVLRSTSATGAPTPAGDALRCGIARDESGLVVPFVLEEGGVILPDTHGDTFEITFTPCDASVLSAKAVR